MAGENVFGNPIIIPAGGFFGFGSDASDSVVVAINEGDPNGVVSANLGSFILDFDTPALWQNTDGADAWAQIPGAGDVPALASAGFFETQISAPNGGAGPFAIPHGLVDGAGNPRVPNFVMLGIVAGTDGASNSLGTLMPPSPPLLSPAPDDTNIYIDMTATPANFGGYSLRILAG